MTICQHAVQDREDEFGTMAGAIANPFRRGCGDIGPKPASTLSTIYGMITWLPPQHTAGTRSILNIAGTFEPG